MHCFEFHKAHMQEVACRIRQGVPGPVSWLSACCAHSAACHPLLPGLPPMPPVRVPLLAPCLRGGGACSARLGPAHGKWAQQTLSFLVYRRSASLRAAAGMKHAQACQVAGCPASPTLTMDALRACFTASFWLGCTSQIQDSRRGVSIIACCNTAHHSVTGVQRCIGMHAGLVARGADKTAAVS